MPNFQIESLFFVDMEGVCTIWDDDSELFHSRVFLEILIVTESSWCSYDMPHTSCPGSSVIVGKYCSKIYYLIKT